MNVLPAVRDHHVGPCVLFVGPTVRQTILGALAKLVQLSVEFVSPAVSFT